MSVSNLCLPLLGLSALPLDTLIDLVQPQTSHPPVSGYLYAGSP